MSNTGMTLRGKLLAMTATTVIALAVLFSALLINGKSQMLEDREAKVRNLVEATQGILSFYEKASRDGQMSVEDAKKAAAAAIGTMRYDKVEYFWIHDARDATMIMHPIKPELNGKNLDQLKDKGGKQLFNEMNRVVKASGSGFVDYLWPKPGSALTPSSLCSGVWASPASSASRCWCFPTISSRHSVAIPPWHQPSPNALLRVTWQRQSTLPATTVTACSPISAPCRKPCAR